MSCLHRVCNVPAICAFLLLAMITAPCGKLRAADAPLGKLLISSASYGDLPDGTIVDVTAKVVAMVKDNSLSVKANKANLGDVPGVASKKLKVAYTVDGVYRSKIVNEGETLDISTRLSIRKAVYGDVAGGKVDDVTEQVADMVRKNTLQVAANNDNFGDPANGVVKHLKVDYTFDGKAQSKTVKEGETLSITE